MAHGRLSGRWVGVGWPAPEASLPTGTGTVVPPRCPKVLQGLRSLNAIGGPLAETVRMSALLRWDRNRLGARSRSKIPTPIGCEHPF